MESATVWLDVYDNTAVVCRRFVGPTDSGDRQQADQTAADRLEIERFEAAWRWLQQAEGHPVVQLVHYDRRLRLMATAYAGPATLATTGLGPEHSARLLAAVALALGRLHRHGLVHGNLTAEHILLQGPRFLLCSPAGVDREPADDVAALGRVIEELLARRAATNTNPSPLDGWRQLAAAAQRDSPGALRLAARLERLADAQGPRWPTGGGRRRLRPTIQSPGAALIERSLRRR